MGRGRMATGAAVAGALALTGGIAGCSAAAGGTSAGHHARHQAAARTSPADGPDPSSIGQPVTGLVPAQIAQVYDVSPLWRRGINGAHQTIVVVDSFGSPTIARDLAAFDTAFNLRAPASLRIIRPAGPVPRYRPTGGRTGWASETTLDVEWAHAIAPAASIVLAETPTAENEGRTGFPQIVTAEKYVLRHHLGQVISQSFGATEETFRSPAQLKALRGAYQLADQDGVTVLAASGDNGASGETYNMKSVYARRVVEWPASDPLVTAVGGTQLRLSQAGRRRHPDVAWSDSGGGRSAVFSRPAYQDGVQSLAGGARAIPDISMDASCGSSVAIYASYPGAGPSRWQTICGTSLATPLFAGVVAMADQVAGHPLGLINPAIYKMVAARDPGLVDVTSGTNTVTGSRDGKVVTIRGYPARPGYDLVTGAGTVNAADFVPELARLAGAG
ncbi:MAG: S53 family peptidase [Streptosporangiaceae bacterium]